MISKKNWCNYKSAKAYYKNIKKDIYTKSIYNMSKFKTQMRKIKNKLLKDNIYTIYVGWIGPDKSENLFDYAYDILEDKYHIDPSKTMQILYCDDILYRGSKKGIVELVINSHWIKLTDEKKNIISKTFTKYFGNNLIEITKYDIKIQLDILKDLSK